LGLDRVVVVRLGGLEGLEEVPVPPAEVEQRLRVGYLQMTEVDRPGGGRFRPALRRPG
jgi:hypothetical protein